MAVLGVSRTVGPPRTSAGGGASPAGAGRRTPDPGARPPLAIAVGPLLAAVAGCASLAPLPERPEPIPYADTLPIREPKAREPVEPAQLVEMALIEEVGKIVDTRRWVGKEREALNLTHFDDVVSSAWFEHRNGRRPLATEEVRAGPGGRSGPDTARAMTVTAGKPEGVMPGFFIEDARGRRYLIKFDPRGHLRLASSADAIASRLVWAAGYHVPSDDIVIFDPERLVLAQGATIVVGGRERAMRRDDLEAILARTDRLPDGRYLGLASRFIDGVPKGPFAFEGRRPDDPNDRYDHEYRRELRGLFVLAAWLNHVDMRPGNTLDAYVVPSGYLRHYLIDFASSLGSGGIRPHVPREGREHNFDFWPTMARLFTLGFYEVGWEGETVEPIHPAIGWMPVDTYEPGAWKPNWPSPPWRLMTPADGYWGAKLVASFSDRQIRAAVEAAALPPAAEDTLVKVLAHRRDRTVEHWYRGVAPVEEPEVVGGPGSGFTLLFRDLALERGLRRAEETRYRWELVDEAGGARGEGEAAARPGGRQRIRVAVAGGSAAAARGAGGSLVLRLQVLERGTGAGRPARVFLRRAGDAYRVSGLFH